VQGVTHSLVKALRAVPELERLPDETLLEIVGASVNLFWGAGSVVFKEGEPSDGLYIVLSGQVAVHDAGGREVARVGPGDYFGEQSLLLHTNRSKTIVAAEDSELLVLSREGFAQLVEHHPDLVTQVRDKLQARLAAGERPSPSPG
jgi:CRP-like cAMP-binding protein